MNDALFKLNALELTPARPRRLVRTGVEWTIDLRHGTAMHESGLVVCFVRHSAAGWSEAEMTTLDLCWAPGGYPVWAVGADKAAVRDTLKAFEAENDAAAAGLLATLSQEARQAWLAAWSKADAVRLPREQQPRETRARPTMTADQRVTEAQAAGASSAAEWQQF